MIENVTKPFDDVGIKKDQIYSTYNISQWIDGLLPELYSDQMFDIKKKIPTNLVMNRTDDTTSFLDLQTPDLAKYAVFFKNNYFTGMRISTVYAELMSSEKTLLQEVIPEKRSEKFISQNNLKASEFEPPLGNFIYWTKDVAKSADDGKDYGDGYVKFFAGD
jgi:hypothetical protein